MYSTFARWFLAAAIIIFALSPAISFAGGDQNTNRGPAGEQIGEPSPDPVQDSERPRVGDPNPNQETVPE